MLFCIHFSNYQEETRGRELSKIRCNNPIVTNRIITPIQAETVGRSPRFIGSLVSSIATIIADTIKVSCSYLPKLFTITNPFQVLPPNTLLLL